MKSDTRLSKNLVSSMSSHCHRFLTKCISKLVFVSVKKLVSVWVFCKVDTSELLSINVWKFLQEES